VEEHNAASSSNEVDQCSPTRHESAEEMSATRKIEELEHEIATKMSLIEMDAKIMDASQNAIQGRQYALPACDAM